MYEVVIVAVLEEMISEYLYSPLTADECEERSDCEVTCLRTGSPVSNVSADFFEPENNDQERNLATMSSPVTKAAGVHEKMDESKMLGKPICGSHNPRFPHFSLVLLVCSRFPHEFTLFDNKLIWRFYFFRKCTRLEITTWLRPCEQSNFTSQTKSIFFYDGSAGRRPRPDAVEAERAFPCQ
jgi:hypothetical protein